MDATASSLFVSIHDCDDRLLIACCFSVCSLTAATVQHLKLVKIKVGIVRWCDYWTQGRE